MSTQKKSNNVVAIVIIIIVAIILIIAAFFCGKIMFQPQQNVSYQDEEITGLEHKDGYKLAQTTILSRHNIRSPLVTDNSTLKKITPHDWFEWTAPGSQLSLKGGLLETEMGQYFRKYFDSEGLVPENYMIQGDEIVFYSNSMQRTIATAQYFSSGMLPVANAEIVWKAKYNTMDPVFSPVITKLSDSLKETFYSDIAKLANNYDSDVAAVTRQLKDEYAILEDCLDFYDSQYAKEKDAEHLDYEDIEVNYEIGKEPSMTGSLKDANYASDAFKLQYYEENIDEEATFGKNFGRDEWNAIGHIGDVYQETLFAPYSVAINVANPMLKELEQDMKNTGRKVTFLCGHDSNLLSVTHALKVEEYFLPNTISKKTPIGSKLVFNKYTNSAGEEFFDINIVYQTVNELRDSVPLSLNYPPMAYPLNFEGISRNQDGLFKASDVYAQFDAAIAAYDAQQ